MALGLPLMLGLHGAEAGVGIASNKGADVSKKISDFVEDSPVLKGAIHSFKQYGEELGVSPRSTKALESGTPNLEGGTPFALIDTKRATDITNDLLTERNNLGKLVQNSLVNENSNKIKIDATDLKQELDAAINKLELEMPTIKDDRLSKSVLDIIKNKKYTDLSPKELKDTLDTISMYITKMSAYKIPSPEMQDTLEILRPFRNSIDSKLKTAVPDYGVAAERFYDFNRAYLEQPLAGRFNPDTKDLYYSDLKNGEQSVIEAFEKLIQQTGTPSKSSMNQIGGLAQLKNSTSAFEQKELARNLKDGGPIRNAQDFINKIKLDATDSSVRQSVLQTQENTSGGKLGILDALGFAPTGRGNINLVAQKVGSIKKGIQSGAITGPIVRSPAQISRAVMKAPDNYLLNLASRLDSVGLKSAGQALKESIETGNTYKKQAALFTILQNPSAKLYINTEDFQDEKEE